jgi:phosphohistidine phosphatase
MELFLLRHGIAVERGTAGYDDDEKRPLTPEGRKKTERVAEAVKTMKLSFDRVLSSPLVRAQQTATIVVKTLKLQKRLRFSRHLATDAGLDGIIRELARLRRSTFRVLLVGHEPQLSELISILVTGKPGLRVTMKKGGLCKLTITPPAHPRSATLEWLLTPRQMTRMKRRTAERC